MHGSTRLSRVATAIALALLAIPRLASAEPATVKLFEAPVRASPAPDAAVIHTFAEKAEVSVSEDAVGGFRRVRLPDGSVGWIEERALAFPRSSLGVAPPPTPAPAAPAPDLRPRIFVKDLGHLAELVKEDPQSKASADRLVVRRNAAWGIGGVGLAAGTAMIVTGASRGFSDARTGGGSGGNGGDALFIGGIGTVAAATLAAVLVHPRRDDLLDVLNGWNVRHPERPFEISSGEVRR